MLNGKGDIGFRAAIRFIPFLNPILVEFDDPHIRPQIGSEAIGIGLSAYDVAPFGGLDDGMGKVTGAAAKGLVKDNRIGY